MTNILGFDVNEKLISVLSKVFGVKSEEITPRLTKEDVGNWDSLKQMDLVVTIENKFDVSLEIFDIVKMSSVAGIIEVLKEKGVDLGD